MKHLHWFLTTTLTSFLLVNCGQQQSQETINDDLALDSLDTNKVDSITTPPAEDPFDVAIDNFSEARPEYNPVGIELVETLNDYSKHWLFKVINGNRKRLQQFESVSSKQQLLRLPDSLDYEMITSIRQALFYMHSKGSKDVVFEQWVFENSMDAEHWLSILSDSLRSSMYTKPPRFQWTEGSKLYLVSTRSAQQWFQMSDTLIMQLSGKTKNQMHAIYKPFDLKHFKKWNGSSHSSVLGRQPHLFVIAPEQHYSYFYFTKQRLSGAERAQSSMEFRSKAEFSITTTLHQPFTGAERYDNIEETLVEIQCAIEETGLNSLNIVGKSNAEVTELFGSSIYKKDTLRVFGHSNRIILAEIIEGKVTRFKYMRLNDSFERLKENADMLNDILRFQE